VVVGIAVSVSVQALGKQKDANRTSSLHFNLIHLINPHDTLTSYQHPPHNHTGIKSMPSQRPPPLLLLLFLAVALFPTLLYAFLLLPVPPHPTSSSSSSSSSSSALHAKKPPSSKKSSSSGTGASTVKGFGSSNKLSSSSSSSSSTPQHPLLKDKSHLALIDWIQTQGGQINHLAIASIQPYNIRGIITLKPFKQGDTIISIPHSLALDVTPPSLPPSSSSSSTLADPVPAALELLRQLDDEKVKTRYAPYLAMVPSASTKEGEGGYGLTTGKKERRERGREGDLAMLPSASTKEGEGGYGLTTGKEGGKEEGCFLQFLLILFLPPSLPLSLPPLRLLHRQRTRKPTMAPRPSQKPKSAHLILPISLPPYLPPSLRFLHRFRARQSPVAPHPR